MPFGPIAELQERLRRDVLDGRGDETLLLLEHHPVITLGRSAEPGHVLAAAPELARRGISLHRASRGGDVTYHGPGQLVGYPVVRLDRGVVGHVRAMADGLIQVLAGLGIAATWRRDAPGLWVQGPRGETRAEARTEARTEAKICSFGVNVHRRVAVHGFALNVAVDLDAFGLIIPCGLPGVAMTSIDRLVSGAAATRPLTPERLAGEVASALGRSFRRDFEVVDPARLFRTEQEDQGDAECASGTPAMGSHPIAGERVDDHGRDQI
ncbi:MAG TPA: lipoyl(octanoyl) transferase LipB [Polyangia bacterium]|jgi:lipoate-protein ligase B|nr:lipoyl(octanoyl) transferase LipB [Polyangia bacterium]